MIVKKLCIKRNEDLEFEIQKFANNKELLIFGRLQKNYFTFTLTEKEAQELRGFLFEEIEYRGPIKEIGETLADPKKRGPKPKEKTE